MRGIAGVVVGLGFASLGWGLLRQAMARQGFRGLGPADRVTVARAGLACVVAALTTNLVVGDVASGRSDAGTRGLLVALASVALVLDAVDGWVARRTGTASALGARLDMEADAFLVLVLSVAAAPVLGWWVLAIGAFRYALAAASRVAPWLGGSVPARYWRKVVAAVQGIALTAATAEVLPRPAAAALVAAALVLLGWSFGTQVAELWHQRDPSALTGPRGTARGVLRWAALTPLVVVWLLLVAPDDPGDQPLTWLLRMPLEPVVLLGGLLLLPPRWHRAVALVGGAVVGVVTVVKVLDLGFTSALRRPFDLLGDWGYLRSARDLLADSVGPGWATAAVIACFGLVVALVVLVPLSAALLVRRLGPLVDRRRTGWSRALVALAAVWLVTAAAHLEVAPGLPLASTSSVGVVADHVARTRTALADRAEFTRDVAADPFRDAEPADLLTGLRGKDVLLVFVESYGEVALSGSPQMTAVASSLDRADRQLGSDGYTIRSGWLDSPTFGGTSWLAHSTLQSGVWVDSQRRYDQLLSTDRLSLSGAFARAGWRTVADVPSNRMDWSEGQRFYGYSQVYDARDVGYAGPRFGYATMPDQYTLKAFADRELTARPRAPVMAEIDLVTSHVPWAPLPQLVPWDAIGDGSLYGPIRDAAATRAQVWRDPASVQRAYAQSIAYSLDSLVGLVRRVDDDDLVVVLLGDHQPSSVVSGPQAGHRVPITLLAHDPAVTAQVTGWGWADGMRPAASTPTWRMDQFRDRVLTAFGPATGAAAAFAGSSGEPRTGAVSSSR